MMQLIVICPNLANEDFFLRRDISISGMWGGLLFEFTATSPFKFSSYFKQWSKERERERRGKSLYQKLACLFHLTENFLADAFAFLWSDRHASYVQEHVHHYSATGHPASLWEMFSFFDWDSQFGHMMTTISSKVIYSKYFRNSNESCTFLLLGRFGQSKCLKHKLEH